MAAPLSHLQKRYLSQLAARAWKLAEREVGSPEQFRHDEVARAVGKAGLRCCSQDDFLRVKAHFLDLCGDSGGAFNAHVRAETEPRRTAQNKLTEACQEFGLSLEYAAKICRAQNRGAGLDAVDDRALWRLVFTIRNRGRAKTRKTKNEHENENENQIPQAA